MVEYRKPKRNGNSERFTRAIMKEEAVLVVKRISITPTDKLFSSYRMRTSTNGFTLGTATVENVAYGKLLVFPTLRGHYTNLVDLLQL